VDRKINILLADRNRHVRNFLQRELAGEGYQVILAAEDRELLHLLHSDHLPDLLILDPDLPSYSTKAELLDLLHSHYPDLPIVVYTLTSDDRNYAEMAGVVGCLEKGEDIGFLKKLIAEVIQKYTERL
jgi:DNA-binding NtrC family response regulator